MWEVEYTDQFEEWWNTLDADEQESVAVSVRLLQELGPKLRFPHTSGVKGSRHRRMRELRTQHAGQPYRTLYAFDPRRVAILLIGGAKSGDERWYEVHVPLADKIYEQHLREIAKEDPDNG
jgi:hypothetical protein